MFIPQAHIRLFLNRIYNLCHFDLNPNLNMKENKYEDFPKM